MLICKNDRYENISEKEVIFCSSFRITQINSILNEQELSTVKFINETPTPLFLNHKTNIMK